MRRISLAPWPLFFLSMRPVAIGCVRRSRGSILLDTNLLGREAAELGSVEKWVGEMQDCVCCDRPSACSPCRAPAVPGGGLMRGANGHARSWAGEAQAQMHVHERSLWLLDSRSQTQLWNLCSKSKRGHPRILQDEWKAHRVSSELQCAAEAGVNSFITMERRGQGWTGKQNCGWGGTGDRCSLEHHHQAGRKAVADDTGDAKLPPQHSV